jgi:hypothetical protein
MGGITLLFHREVFQSTPAADACCCTTVKLMGLSLISDGLSIKNPALEEDLRKSFRMTAVPSWGNGRITRQTAGLAWPGRGACHAGGGSLGFQSQG